MNSIRSAEPGRTIYLSDTFGGPIDATQRVDVDVDLCTRLRSSPFEPFRLHADTFGNEQATHHVIRLIRGLVQEVDSASHFSDAEKKEFLGMGTGVLINAAPRINGQNGHPFYVAELERNIRVVATPLAALSPVRDSVISLHELPNTGSGLYDDGEQFRSSYTGILLNRELAKRFPLQERSSDIIPPPIQEDHLGYVDRFGNLITHSEENERLWDLVSEIARQCSGKVLTQVGDAAKLSELGSTLGENTPGDTHIYLNGRGVDVARKWRPEDRTRDKISRSAYYQLSRDSKGEIVRPEPGDQFAVHPVDHADLLRERGIHVVSSL